MRVSFLTILLSALFIIPINAATDKREKAHIHNISIERKTTTRAPSDFNITVKDKDNTLVILFQSPLRNAEVSITDSNGNAVINESQTTIYEGKMLYIHAPNAYPYIIEITSPTMDITGEITQEEI